MPIEICLARRKVTFVRANPPVGFGANLQDNYLLSSHYITVRDKRRIFQRGFSHTNSGDGLGIYLGTDGVTSTAGSHSKQNTLVNFYPEDTIRKCARCVDNPNRKCDLEAWTAQDLDPQE